MSKIITSLPASSRSPQRGATDSPMTTGPHSGPSFNSSKQSEAHTVEANQNSSRTCCPTAPKRNVEPAISSGGSSAETAVIFDWDDTLLPSSFVVNSTETLSEVLSAVRPLQARSYRIIGNTGERALALSHRYVFILSSSGPGWVEQSCRLYYPQALPLLSKVTIVHANEFCREFAMVNLQFRNYCNSAYFRSPKLASVLAILPALQPEPRRVVLIGDQYADVSIAEALRQRGGDIRTCLFAVEPTARELVSVGCISEFLPALGRWVVPLRVSTLIMADARLLS
ncbi:hypothetical protein FOZ60_000857 [Perkinsus olseni]|uniref:Uncharacterized protein n=1 Tax=Perkinsus olseni TaxID=32597 RepID=A0A7J6PLC9_PEROL|nr:hypothetical protein FOZ60_000857 [Perkinsus olseni]